MTDSKKKTRAPAQVEVYCVVSNATTSKGRIFHGDTVKLPEAEATALKAEGKVT